MPPFARRLSLTEPLAGMMENPKVRQGLSALSNHLRGGAKPQQDEETKDDNTVQFDGHESFQSQSTFGGEGHLSFNRHVAFHCSFTSVDTDYGEEEKEEDDFIVDDAVSAQRRLETSVLGITLFLKTNGADPDDVEKLVQMEQRLQYTTLLKTAEALTEDLVVYNKMNKKRSEEVLNLFITAWKSLQEYAQDRYQQIHQAHSKMQMQLWKQQMARVSGEDEESDEEDEEDDMDTSAMGVSLKLWRSGSDKSMDDSMGGSTRLWSSTRRSMLSRRSEQEKEHAMRAEEAAQLASQLANAMRFKIDCQKQHLLTKEWVRCMQRQTVVDADC